MREVLIAIHPEWVQQIYAGLKTAEIRKSLPRLPFKVRFMETGGAKLITGEATVYGALAYAPRPGDPIDRDLLDAANLSETQLRGYARDGFVFAWHLEHVRKYPEPKPYKGRSPQSWQYLPFAEDQHKSGI